MAEGLLIMISFVSSFYLKSGQHSMQSQIWPGFDNSQNGRSQGTLSKIARELTVFEATAPQTAFARQNWFELGSPMINKQ
jgi:hypothetical protein